MSNVLQFSSIPSHRKYAHRARLVSTSSDKKLSETDRRSNIEISGGIEISAGNDQIKLQEQRAVRKERLLRAQCLLEESILLLSGMGENYERVAWLIEDCAGQIAQTGKEQRKEQRGGQR